MFTFLQRLGRLFVVTTILMAVGTIIGITSYSGILVASHHNGASSAMACTVASSGVGGSLTVSGHGFGANTQYLLFLTNPAGSGETTVNTDATGAFTYSSYASWHGTYAASVWSAGSGSKEVAGCTALTL
jgi:hypothetical protein